jgi:hypothetical protein
MSVKSCQLPVFVNNTYKRSDRLNESRLTPSNSKADLFLLKYTRVTDIHCGSERLVPDPDPRLIKLTLFTFFFVLSIINTYQYRRNTTLYRIMLTFKWKISFNAIFVQNNFSFEKVCNNKLYRPGSVSGRFEKSDPDPKKIVRIPVTMVAGTVITYQYLLKKIHASTINIW